MCVRWIHSSPDRYSRFSAPIDICAPPGLFGPSLILSPRAFDPAPPPPPGCSLGRHFFSGDGYPMFLRRKLLLFFHPVRCTGPSLYGIKSSLLRHLPNRVSDGISSAETVSQALSLLCCDAIILLQKKRKSPCVVSLPHPRPLPTALRPGAVGGVGVTVGRVHVRPDRVPLCAQLAHPLRGKPRCNSSRFDSFGVICQHDAQTPVHARCTDARTHSLHGKKRRKRVTCSRVSFCLDSFASTKRR